MNNRVTITFSSNFLAGDSIVVYYSDPSTQTSGYWTFTWVNGTAGAFDVQVDTPTTTTGEIEARRFASSWTNSLNGFTVTQPVGNNDNQVQITSQTYHFVNVLAKFNGGSTMAIPANYGYVLSTVSTGNKITYPEKVALNTQTAPAINLWMADDANEVKTKFNLNDDRIGTLETDKADLVGGNDFTGDQTIDGDVGIGTTSPNSKLHLIKSKNSTNNEIGTFIDVEQASSATGSNYNYAQIVRSLFSGSGTIGDVWGAQFIARANGSGNVNQLIGFYSLADLEGTADATTVISNYSLSEIKGTGSSTLDDVLGVWAKLEIENANTNITDAYASCSNIDIKAGTVGNLILQMLDYDFSSANQSNVSVNNVYYIKAKNDAIPNVSGNAYFIFSESVLPSFFAGKISAKTLKAKVTTYENLPSNAETGDIATINDANNISYRATAAGGGSDVALVFFNGTDWIYH